MRVVEVQFLDVVIGKCLCFHVACLYRDTVARMQLFKDQGHRVLYVWGSDWKRTTRA